MRRRKPPLRQAVRAFPRDSVPLTRRRSARCQCRTASQRKLLIARASVGTQPSIEFAMGSTRVCFVLKTEYEIIRVTNDDNVAFRMSFPPLLDPEIEDIVEIHVRKKWRDRRSLLCTLWCPRPFPVLEDACGQPFSDQRQGPRIRYPVLKELHHPAVVDGVEEATDVCLKHPVHLLPQESVASASSA